MPFANRM